MLIDTHAHIYLKQFDNDRAATLERAKAAGIERIYLPAVDSETHEAMLALEADAPDFCIAMMGVHPCSIEENYENELKIAEKYLQERPFCAIGEIGLDLYWEKKYFEQQKKAFVTQMQWSQDLGLPIIIHSRESMDEVIEILEKNRWHTEGGILHCFTGNLEQAKRLVDLGFYLGIGGVATYKNGGLEPVIAEIPLEHLVLETDAPYLAPVPFRGKRNESAYIRHVAQRISEVKMVDFKEVEAKTTANALRIFAKYGQFVISD